MKKVERALMVIGGLTVVIGAVDVGRKAVAGVKNYLQIRKMIKKQNEAVVADAVEAWVKTLEKDTFEAWSDEEAAAFLERYAEKTLGGKKEEA